jgi:uncharacterized iron-regulated protein
MSAMKVHALLISLVLTLSTVCQALSQNEIYQFFDAEGNKTSYREMLEDLQTAEILFFGELHNDPIGHYFQTRLLKDLYASKKDGLILGMEMFEADDQLKLDEYIQGLISQKSFETEARLWTNYSTDYKSIIEYAKENKIKVVGTNVPRRYASALYQNGFDMLQNLNQEQKKLMVPLPFPIDRSLSTYQPLDMANPMHGNANQKKYLLESQALKDATMAHRIESYFEEGKTFLHINGSYHSDYREGIVHYLGLGSVKNKSIKIISVKKEKIIHTFNPENANLADYILQVAEDMNTSY